VHTEAVLLPVPCMPWTENSCGWHSNNRHCVVVTAVQAKPHMVLLCWQGRDGSSGSSSSNSRCSRKHSSCIRKHMML
jgi:hypothetical protein